jgi:hypothetical protein
MGAFKFWGVGSVSRVDNSLLYLPRDLEGGATGSPPLLGLVGAMKIILLHGEYNLTISGASTAGNLLQFFLLCSVQ